MARLTTARRNALPASDFAGPNRSYPINDPSHARFANAMAAKNAGPALQSRVAADVHRKYPGIGKPSAGRDQDGNRQNLDEAVHGALLARMQK